MKNKKYLVNICQIFSEDIVVSACSPKEAKTKAWEKYNPKKKNFEIEIEDEH